MTDDEKNNQWPKWSEMDDTGKGITVMFWIFLFALVGRGSARRLLPDLDHFLKAGLKCA